MAGGREVLMKTEWTDPVTGAKGYLVIDELFDGLCGGGIRMRPGLDSGEVEELARVMTNKFMAMGIPCGGAKGGINYDSRREDASGVLKRYLLAHRPFLRENWGTSEDLGTSEGEIMALLAEMDVRTSAHAILTRFSPEEGAELLGNLVTGLNMEYDGMIFNNVATGYGVSVAAREALKRTGVEPGRARAAVQGFGTVGGGTAFYLARQGVKVVAVADIEGTVYCEAGLDIPDLLQKRDEKGIIDRTKLPAAYKLEPRDRWMELEVELAVPAAISGAITTENAGHVRAGLVVEGANMPITREAASMLFGRGVKIVPDFIANSGGVGLFGALLFHRLPPEPQPILEYLDKTITDSVNRIFDLSAERDISLYDAARRLVEERKKEVPASAFGS